MIGSVEYEKIDDAGLHIKVVGKPQLLEVDHPVAVEVPRARREARTPGREQGQEILESVRQVEKRVVKPAVVWSPALAQG